MRSDPVRYSVMIERRTPQSGVMRQLWRASEFTVCTVFSNVVANANFTSRQQLFGSGEFEGDASSRGTTIPPGDTPFAAAAAPNNFARHHRDTRKARCDLNELHAIPANHAISAGRTLRRKRQTFQFASARKRMLLLW